MPTGYLVQLCMKKGVIGMVDVVETGLKMGVEMGPDPSILLTRSK